MILYCVRSIFLRWFHKRPMDILRFVMTWMQEIECRGIFVITLISTIWEVALRFFFSAANASEIPNNVQNSGFEKFHRNKEEKKNQVSFSVSLSVIFYLSHLNCANAIKIGNIFARTKEPTLLNETQVLNETSYTFYFAPYIIHSWKMCFLLLVAHFQMIYIFFQVVAKVALMFRDYFQPHKRYKIESTDHGFMMTLEWFPLSSLYPPKLHKRNSFGMEKKSRKTYKSLLIHSFI